MYRFIALCSLFNAASGQVIESAVRLVTTARPTVIINNVNPNNGPFRTQNVGNVSTKGLTPNNGPIRTQNVGNVSTKGPRYTFVDTKGATRNARIPYLQGTCVQYNLVVAEYEARVLQAKKTYRALVSKKVYEYAERRDALIAKLNNPSLFQRNLVGYKHSSNRSYCEISNEDKKLSISALQMVDLSQLLRRPDELIGWNAPPHVNAAVNNAAVNNQGKNQSTGIQLPASKGASNSLPMLGGR